MRVLVTGAKGQLGYDLCRRLSAQGIDYLGIGVEDGDLTHAEQVDRVFAQYAPNVVIHCAAYTAVDRAEVEEELCRKVNVDATANVAAACKEHGAALMYISTDYVFSGDGDRPFEVDAPHAPLNVYGRTKSEGEAIVRSLLDHFYIIRISWVFGLNGRNFVKTMLRLGADRESVNVVSDQIGSPTYTYDLSRLLVDIILSEKYGVYHATNEGTCSWAEFAGAIMTMADLQCKVQEVPTSDYPTAAIRPLNSRLSKISLDHAGFYRLPPWQDALNRFLHEMSLKEQ